jgi:hypothetical protein
MWHIEYLLCMPSDCVVPVSGIMNTPSFTCMCCIMPHYHGIPYRVHLHRIPRQDLWATTPVT